MDTKKAVAESRSPGIVASANAIASMRPRRPIVKIAGWGIGVKSTGASVAVAAEG